jgi:hypothetical protein
MCQYHTLRVVITVVRITIIVVSVVITFVRVKITLCLEITLCVLKSHSACGNYTLRIEFTLYVDKSHSCVLKSHFSFRNYTRACVHHSMRMNITHKSDFYMQSVVLTHMCVIITFVSAIIKVIRVNTATLRV